MYYKDYFISTNPNIYGNPSLRKPQERSYLHCFNHFVTKRRKDPALIVLPTGVGKTGVMAILPFGISEGRVLIITPGLVVRDTIIKHLDTATPDCFLYKYNIIPDLKFMPTVSVYQGDETPVEVLSESNVVLVNIQKLQNRLDSSLLNKLNPDFFDMIIIDEAHHSVASTWIDTVAHFSDAKIVKLTGTPERSDGQKIKAQLVYNYKLSWAMNDGLIKSLENFEFLPDEVEFEHEGKTYDISSIDELMDSNSNFVSKSVALSKSCNENIVDRSIEILQKLKNNNGIPHKIIAVACGIEHAKSIALLYLDKGLKTAIIYSDLQQSIKDQIYNDLDNNRYDVIVHVNMLGEGFDHKYLSIAALFRPYRTLLPYEQFIGRILRRITDQDASDADNIGYVISHKYLNLLTLWNYYKREKEELDIIKHLTDTNSDVDSNMDDEDLFYTGDDYDALGNNVIELAKVRESKTGEILKYEYLDTPTIMRARIEEKEMEATIKKIMDDLKIDYQQARFIVQSVKTKEAAENRPDLIWSNTKKNLDDYIKLEITPELLAMYGLSPKDNSLLNYPEIFGSYFKNIVYLNKKRNLTNDGIIPLYISLFLNNRIGCTRSKWSSNDYQRAFELLGDFKPFLFNKFEANFDK